MNRRAPEVHRRVTSCDDTDIEFPARTRRVTWDQIVWFLADLNPDADVVEPIAVRITERPSGEIETVDHNSHTFSLAPLANRSDCSCVHGFAHVDVNAIRTTPGGRSCRRCTSLRCRSRFAPVFGVMGFSRR